MGWSQMRNIHVNGDASLTEVKQKGVENNIEVQSENEKVNPSLYLDFALAYKKIGDLDSYRDILEAGVDIPVPHCDVSDVAGFNQSWPITWCCKGVMFLQKFELDGSTDS
ncbi:hypothetical protein TrCOL_g2287 [Triparma columacea]|uniref:Uncharacterized protein n=1 Tax=Triparma columacea TaxID=722753 RepID=A0A9W7FZX4_9STRA|nr:hypothetical protein TrCOL_g2287 [Triparma columacea]